MKVQTQTDVQRFQGVDITGTLINKDKVAQDVFVRGFAYEVATDTVDSYDSSMMSITAASHSALAGDIVRFTTGPLATLELSVYSVTANEILLADQPGASPSAGNAFTIYRSRIPTVDSNGNMFTSSVSGGPIQIKKDGADTYVTKDTVTPSNTVPIPVEVVAASGSPINITAGDLNVQLTHAGANYDSTRIGDGTNLLGVTASNEAKTSDATAATKLDSLLTELQLKADLTETQPVSAASLPLPTGASTLAEQQTQTTHLATLAGAVTAAKVQAEIVTQLPAGTNNIGDVDVLSLPSIPAGTNNIGDVDVLTLPSIPAGTNNIGDVDVVSVVPTSGRSKVTILRNDYSSVNVTTSAYTQLVASTGAVINKLQIFDSSGQTLVLAVGAAASEVDQIYIFPGGNGDVDLAIPASSRISIKAVSATASVGEISINCLS